MRYEASRAKDLHTKLVPDARVGFAPVFAFLSTATDCVGPTSCVGLPGDRVEALERRRWQALDLPNSLVACRDLVDELVAAGRPTRIDWVFEFRLLSPGPAVPFVYPSSAGLHPSDDPLMSRLSLSQHTSQPTTLALRLAWPVGEDDPRFASSRDQVFAALGIKPRPRCWLPSAA